MNFNLKLHLKMFYRGDERGFMTESSFIALKIYKFLFTRDW